jgi:hypothetical protein
MEDDDERFFETLDPAKLLPFTCVLEPSSEHTQKLPRQFGVGGDDLYSGTAVF